jgi:MFS family permease
VLGAFIVEYLPWGMVFWINVPFAVLAMAMIARFLDESAPSQSHRLDRIGAVLLMAGSGAMLVMVMEFGVLDGWTTAVLLGFTLVTLVAFAFYERLIAEPIIPAALWQNGIVVKGGLGSFLIGAVFMCTVVILPTYIQGVLGRSALVAGIVLTVQSLSWSLGSTVSGRLMVHTSYRTSATIGSLCMIAGSVALAALDPRVGTVVVAIAACAIGAGIGFCSVTFVVSTQANVGQAIRGAATSSVLFARMIGQALGAALGGAILNLHVARSGPGLADAMNKLLTPALRDSMTVEDMATAIAAAGAAAQAVFLLVGVVATAALAVALVLPRGVGPATSGPSS